MNLDGGIHEVPVPGATGRLWLCGKHFIGPRFEETLAELPADQIVCLVHEHELRDRYEPYLQWLRTSERSRWFPIHDLSSPAYDDVVSLYRSVTEDLRAGRRIVVHCAAGRGRAGTLAVAVCFLQGLSLEEAMAHVRRHRPGAGPEAGSQLHVLQQMARSDGGVSEASAEGRK